MISANERFGGECRHEWMASDSHSVRALCYTMAAYSTPTLEHGMRLSILLCTIPEREEDFEALWQHLMNQWNSLPLAIAKRVEIIAVSDERRMTIGAKRNLLLDYSCGKYVCFIDDDDWVSEMYLTRLWIASLQDPDCIGFSVKCDNYPKPGQSKLADVGYGKHGERT